MKLVFLSKRCPQGRDLITRSYGRFYHIPRLLAATGLEVHLILIGYKTEQAFTTEQDGLTIHAFHISPNLPKLYSSIKKLSIRIRPDVFVAFSDTWYGILAAALIKDRGARLVIDAYDNYEAYMPWAKPLHWLWRRSLQQADGLTAAGPQLLDLLCRSNPDAQRCVIPMAADPLFQPQSISVCRDRLKLPAGRRLIGYLGTADKTRGFNQFLDALRLLRTKRDDFDLVLSGRSGAQLSLPGITVHQLGYLEDESMPTLLNSCDLLAGVNRDSAFGNYSYPVKIYEALACNTPIVTSATAPARWILNDDSRVLAKVGDSEDLANKLNALLDKPVRADVKPEGWEASAEQFGEFLRRL